MREYLIRGSTEALPEWAGRSDVKLVRAGGPRDVAESNRDGHGFLVLTPEQFARRLESTPKQPSEIGPVIEHRGAFVIRILQSREEDRATITSYVVAKKTWEAAKATGKLDCRS